MLHTDVSKFNSLNVKYNNKGRHYAHPGLPSGDSQGCPNIHRELAPLTILCAAVEATTVCIAILGLAGAGNEFHPVGQQPEL